MANNKSGGSQTVDRALQILECFTLERPSLTLTELSGLTGLTVPTGHRLLKALQRREFVKLDPATKRYSLGPGAMRLAGVIMERDDLQAIVLPHLERLRTATGETVALHWLVEDSRVCVLELISRNFIRMTSGTGRRYPIYAGAASKAILANLPNETVTRILSDAERDGVGPFIDRTRNDVFEELEQIRTDGFAASVGEVIEGASAVAAAIIDASGLPVAAINITGPANRFSADRMTAISGTLVKIVHEVESQMGYIRTSSLPRD